MSHYGSTKQILIVLGISLLLVTAFFSFLEYRNASQNIPYSGGGVEESLSSLSRVVLVILIKIMFLALVAYIGGLLLKYGIGS